MINYIVQIIFFQVLFLAVYDFFLQKETFFKWNRIYLLVTPILSFIIPFIKFDVFQNTVPQQYVVLLPAVVLNPQAVIEQTTNSVATFNYLGMLFYTGIAVVSILFLVKLTKIIRLIISNKGIRKENYTLVLLDNKHVAFSFFKYIFIGKSLEEKPASQIIKHELVHCNQYHSIDLLFFEFFKILMWFNPMIYIYQKRITLLHEYISDAEVVKQTNKKTYFNSLLGSTFNVENIAFINQFYKHSLIKKRIIMITKNKSQKMKQLKYLVLIPLLASMLFYTSCANEEQQLLNEIENELLKGDEITEGKYFRPESQDLILFMGESLKGKVVPFEEYTEKERELFQKLNENASLKSTIVINEGGERVYFIKPLKKGATEITERTEVETFKNIGESVPFAMIENVPVYPGCEGTRAEKVKCLNNSIRKHVSKKFNGGLAKELGLSGKQKIYVKFKITKTGDIEILGARAPHKALEKEAKRVVNILPQMTPGKHKGENVSMAYTLPIVFEVK